MVEIVGEIDPQHFAVSICGRVESPPRPQIWGKVFGFDIEGPFMLLLSQGGRCRIPFTANRTKKDNTGLAVSEI